MSINKEKTLQLLAYLIKKHSKASITVLMKLSYLIDLVSINKYNTQISSFEYERYHYGPFDSGIYSYLQDLNNKKIIEGRTEYTSTGDEYLVYNTNDEMGDLNCDQLSPTELEIIDSVLDSLKGYGAKTLTEMTYKTDPMKKLGATLGGSENLGVRLNLAK